MTDLQEYEDRIIIVFVFTDEFVYRGGDEQKLLLAIRDYTLKKLMEKGLSPFLTLEKSVTMRYEYHCIRFFKPHNWNQIKDSLLL